jgi:hypothetical protein
LFPEGSEYVVPFDAGQDKLDVGADETETDVLVPIIAELDDEELVLADELVIALGELLPVDEDIITAEELLNVDEAAMTVDELLHTEDVVLVDERERDTTPTTRTPAFVVPSYTKAPETDFG